MSRKKRAKPFDPAAAARARLAEESRRFANDPEPNPEEGPSARLLRQMIRHSRPASAERAPPDFEWSEGQLKRIEKAERQLASGNRREIARGRAEMSALVSERDTVLDRKQRSAAAQETAAIAAQHGDDVDAPPMKAGETAKPMRRRSGLEWLMRKKRLSEEQFLSGQRYADDYRVSLEVPLRSCISESRGGGDELTGLEAREEAHQRLKSARIGALNCHPAMIVVCDQVCGEGRTIRQLTGDNDAEAQQTEATLGIALDLLSDHYGIKSNENRVRVSHWA